VPFHYVNPVTGAPVGAGYAPGASVPSPVGGAAAPQTASKLPAMMSSGAAPGSPSLVRLKRSITALQDEQAIEKLQRSFGFFTDKALWKDAADLFTDDGSLELGGGGVYGGRARIQAYFTSLAPQGLQHGWMYNYVQEQPIITLSADGLTARGRWKFLAETGEWQKSAIWGVGAYENEYAKVNGVWRIRRIHRFDRMSTPYVDGWAKTALPLAGPSAAMPPDRPPSVSYQSYPATFVPRLAFPNPVTGK